MNRRGARARTACVDGGGRMMLVVVMMRCGVQLSRPATAATAAASIVGRRRRRRRRLRMGASNASQCEKTRSRCRFFLRCLHAVFYFSVWRRRARARGATKQNRPASNGTTTRPEKEARVTL